LVELAIDCESLVKVYGEKPAVDGLELKVKRGICFGLLGPNGAGKTTTVEMLEGLTAPTSGRIRVLGLEWGKGRDRELRERLGIQLQETVLADKLEVAEVIRLFRSFYRRGREVDELIQRLSLEEHRSKQYHSLSGGLKQRVAVACALVGDPELLFLDEPTTGLDPRARQQLWRIVEEFRDGGGTVVLTTHYMEEAAALCDDLAIMDQGRVIARGTPRSLVDGLGQVQFLEFELSHEVDSEVFRQIPEVERVERRGLRYRLRLDRSLASLSSVLLVLDRQGHVPIGLDAHPATLDDVFLQLTGHSLAPEQEGKN
jgi:ABC-2 type transport system ATP-binding protein